MPGVSTDRQYVSTVVGPQGAFSVRLPDNLWTVVLVAGLERHRGSGPGSTEWLERREANLTPGDWAVDPHVLQATSDAFNGAVPCGRGEQPGYGHSHVVSARQILVSVGEPPNG